GGTVERCGKRRGRFGRGGARGPAFSARLDVDLGPTEPSRPGPKRRHDRLALAGVSSQFQEALRKPLAQDGFGVEEARLSARTHVTVGGASGEIGHGSVVIAAITSCTNTSNPSVLVAAGALSRKSPAHGLRAAPYAKTSL